MAEAGSLEVVISATTDALSEGLSAAIGLISGSIPAFTTAAAGIGAAITAGIAVSLKSYGDLEEAATSLAVALRNSGDASKQTLQDMLDYADALQNASRFSNTEIVSAEAMLATMGLTGDTLKRATQAAVDLATQTGNLTTAAKLLGNAYDGAGTGLKRFGIVLDQGTPQGLMFADAMDQIEQKFGGRAEADMNSFNGQLTQLWRVFDDLGKSLGQALLPTVEDLIAYFQENKDDIVKTVIDVANGIVDIFNAISRLVTFIEDKMSTVQQFWNILKQAADFITAPTRFGASLIAGGGGAAPSTSSGGGSSTTAFQLPHLTAGSADTGTLASEAQSNMGTPGAAGPGPSGAQQFLAAWNDAYKKVFTGAQTITTQIEGVMKGMTSSLASGINGFFVGILEKGQNLGQALMSIGTSMEAFVLKTIADIVAQWLIQHTVMATANALFNTTIAANETAAGVTRHGIQKAEGLAQIPGIIGLTDAQLIQAYASIPFVGPALSAAAIGEANAQIMGFSSLIAMAEGGIVNKPTIAMIGEAGREAVIPLGSPSAKAMMGQSAAPSGDINIHFHGLLGMDQATLGRMTRNIIVPALERHSRKTKATKGKIW